jgi:negative regulator of flagellin synthesis FlgM
MTIDRLGPIDPVQKFNKADKTQHAPRAAEKDSIALSDEARIRAEMLEAAEVVKSGNDVRMDRVEEVKRKLEDPSYIDQRVLETVAERIIDVFDLS